MNNISLHNFKNDIMLNLIYSKEEAIYIAKIIMSERNFCENARSRTLLKLYDIDSINTKDLRKLLYGVR